MISIVVPVYNAAKYIEETIESVINQTYKDWELLLVDDCSKDDSAEVIQEVIRSFEQDEEYKGRIRFIKKEHNEGAAKARNTGIMEAQGRYIAFLDADDIWYPEKLQNELDFMQLHEAAFVYSSYKFGDEDAVPTGKVARVPKHLTYKEALSRTIIFTSTVLLDTKKIDRELILMPDIPSEDTATWWRILQTGITAYGLDEALVIYRRPASSLSSNKGKAVKRIWRLYREIAGLGMVSAAWHMVGWAFNATMRRMLDDAIRNHLESVKRFTVLQLSMIGLVLHTLIYAGIWFKVYYPLISSVRVSKDGYNFGGGLKLYFRGHLVILAIYFFLLLFLSRSNGSMKTGYLRPGRTLTTQVIALGMTNLITYAQLSLMRNWLLPVSPILHAFLGQILLALIWTYLADAIYRCVFPPKDTLVILGKEDREEVAEIVRRFEGRQDKFRVMKLISTSEGMDKVESECLRWYGCVIIGGVYGLQRRELVNFCYSHYIRMYIIPEFADLMLQGAQQMDLFNTPILELKEYNISWEERVIKRIADIILAIVLILITSPVMLFRVIRAAAGHRPVMERTVCLSKDGREFVRHTFSGGGFGWTLPMFFDVLKGSLSMIGPEALPADVERQMIEEDQRFFYRLRVKSGYSGYAASMGKTFYKDHGKNLSKEDANEILKMDMVYVQHYSLLQDFRLVVGILSTSIKLFDKT